MGHLLNYGVTLYSSSYSYILLLLVETVFQAIFHLAVYYFISLSQELQLISREVFVFHANIPCLGVTQVTEIPRYDAHHNMKHQCGQISLFICSPHEHKGPCQGGILQVGEQIAQLGNTG